MKEALLLVFLPLIGGPVQEAVPWWNYFAIAAIVVLLLIGAAYKFLHFLLTFPRLSNEPEEEYEEPPKTTRPA